MSNFKVGDKVKLTGQLWRDGMRDAVYEVVEVDYEGDAFIEHPQTGRWTVFDGNDTSSIHRGWAVEVVEPEPEAKPRAFLIFTGPYELAWSLEDAEERIEELLLEGFEQPTMTKVDLETPSGGGDLDIIGITARKVADVSKQGRISR